MNRVVDASVVVQALVDERPLGDWCRRLLATGGLAAPHHLPAEVTNVLRRGVIQGSVAQEVAALARADLLELSVALFPFEPLAERVWELRGGVATFEAWYVALAEHLDADLVTLDRRLARASGPRCRFLTPPD